ncbi:MAG: diacylglycerol/lipid kinase family protein, partial [Gammaproteobacteria bacterium]
RLAAEGVDVIGINGGDGSVALVLGVLLGDASPFASPPLLCALPGGTTNVTVGDVGSQTGLEQAVLELLAWRAGRRAASVLERPVIGVRAANGQLLGCGLVFGAGAVVDGIEYWHAAVRSRGMRSEFSSGLAMIRTVWGMLRGHDGFGAHIPLVVSLPGRSGFRGEYRLLVVCALQRLFLGIQPFWGEAAGQLRFTAIDRHAQGLATALPGILLGKPARRVLGAPGYHSTRFDTATLEFTGGYTLDGELHHVSEAESPITLSVAGRARFLRTAG